IYLGAIAFGLTLVPGLSYLHIRARARHRALLMSLCTVWLLAGVATTATIAELASLSASGEDVLHQNVAIALLTSSTLTIVLIGLVELLQRESIVDYRRPLDYDTAMAHDSGRLLNPERRSFAPYAQFGRAAPTLGKGVSGTGWSTERIVTHTGQGETGCRYRTLWTCYMVGTKLVGLLAFYWVLLVSGIVASRTVLEQEDVGYLPFWLMVGGATLTTLLALRFAPKTLFLGASVLYVVALVLSIAFYCADLVELEYGIAMLLFFGFLGTALPLPAINILELAPLNCNEAALALGTALEILAIALLQYYGTRDGTLFGMEEPADGGEPVPASNHKDVIAAHYITAIVLGVVCAVATLWHMPNTGRKSLSEIESDLTRMRSYFAFSRRHQALPPPPAVPATNGSDLEPSHDITTVLHANGRVEDALEESPVPQEQLSTRNATRFAGLYPDSTPDPRNGSYHSPASASPNGVSRSRSPYNDFDQHLHYHQQDVVTPHLQQQDVLRRQHEANYLNARLLQQRAVSSPTNSDRLSRGLTPEAIKPLPLLPPLAVRTTTRAEPAIGSLTVKSEPGTLVRPGLLTMKSDAPAPPPMPPADYLTKSLPRVKAVRQSRIPPIVPKPEPAAEVVVPGVEYSHNLVPSQFLRQSLQNSQLFR
uniref:Uncharacterized protein n=1 Tax=Anopheles christyi TaxID=43041 RepID=A0A182KHD0_9DIPT